MPTFSTLIQGIHLRNKALALTNLTCGTNQGLNVYLSTSWCPIHSKSKYNYAKSNFEKTFFFLCLDQLKCIVKIFELISNRMGGRGRGTPLWRYEALKIKGLFHEGYIVMGSFIENSTHLINFSVLLSMHRFSLPHTLHSNHVLLLGIISQFWFGWCVSFCLGWCCSQLMLSLLLISLVWCVMVGLQPNLLWANLIWGSSSLV